jgi:lipoate-protein ligase A
MNRWHLLDDEAMTAAENMARDEFLLERAERVGTAPVLRLYSFDPPAVSIGYHQDPAAVLDLGALARRRIDLVRRITGGRALLHEGELTYAVCAPMGTSAFGAGLVDTFLAISGVLVSALRSLGVDATLGSGRRGHRPGNGAPCLVSVSRYEVAVRGRKIAGSAQRRTRKAFLQHGSILLRPASGRIAGYARGDWPSLENRITSVTEERGGAVRESEVRSALIDAFAARFSIRWEPLELSRADAAELGRRTRERQSEFPHCAGTEVGD